MRTIADGRELKLRLLVNSVSIFVPAAVAVLLGFPDKLYLGEWTKTLPHVIGAANALTTLVLIGGWIFIRRGKIDSHRTMMTAAFGLGALFLVCYVTYHVSNPANRFAGAGAVRYVYLFFLITHVGLSLVVLPLVLRALIYAVTKQFDAHKKIVKYAFPIWLYVSATGVIVYLLLYQLFPSK